MSLTVTLTTTSGRLPVLRHTLLSLLDQNYQADQILLYISKEPYLIDEGVKELPPWLTEMVDLGNVKINWVENTGPYRKLVPAFMSSSDEDWLVTCDDDVIYGPGWLGALVQTAEEYPSAIICGRARRPALNKFGKKQSYLNWPLVPLGARGTELLPIGIAGVLYRKPLLDKATMHSEDFKKLAPKQDDLWFHVARKVTGKEVVVSLEAGKYIYPIEAPGALSATNAGTNLSGWDKVFTALFERLVLRLKAYAGMPICDNDIVIAQLEQYKKSAGNLF